MAICNRCAGTGFLNIEQYDAPYCSHEDVVEWRDKVLAWIEATKDHDVSVCDCCGNGESWVVEEPGYHGPNDDAIYDCM